MSRRIFGFVFLTLISLFYAIGAAAQTTTASISGAITDERGAVVPNATVTARNVDNGVTRTIQTDGDGRYTLVNLPLGSYELTITATNFARYVQTGITLVVNQNAEINVALKAGGVEEVVTVEENASLLNTATAEVSTRFDERRLSELPIATNRNVYNVLLSVPGVSQVSSGQTEFASGVSFSANGGRLRSNNFMLDGQDINDPSVSGGQIQINNPDAIGEVRIITNQFAAEYGRNASSVVNFIGKSGTNDFRGTLFWFHNNERLNACSNLDKRAGFCNPNATDPARRRAPRRLENQVGFTFGGPLYLPRFGEGGPTTIGGKDRTFFFGDFQRWADRQLGSGFTLDGAPTEAGRAVLQSVAGNRPQVAALLRFLPAGTPNGQTRSFTLNGTTYTVPVGSITGSSSIVFDDYQGSFRVDHRFSDKNLLYGRYRFDDLTQTGAGQVTPPGLTNVVETKTKAAAIVLNSILSSKASNEARIAWTRFDSSTNAQDSSSETIPSIEISELGLTGFNAAASRTAIGLAVNLPQFRINDTYQIQNALSYTTGSHNTKFGIDARRNDVKSFFFPTVRGRVAYNTLTNFVNDVALSGALNRPLAGGDVIGFYRYYEFYAYAQDEWRITPNFTLNYGLRYEYPGNSFGYLNDLNQRILAANNNNPNYRFNAPRVDKNNFAPRIGFNWNPRTRGNGFLGFLTGGDRTVIRGGYARTYDANFINVNLNVFSSFPFVAALTFGNSAGQLPLVGAYSTIQNFGAPSSTIDPRAVAQTTVSEDFRAPVTEQLALEYQREITRDTVFKVGYIRTRGVGLLQTIDGNPRLPFSNVRVNPNLGVVRLRTNSASSTYDGLQVSVDKRLSNNFSAGFHYTYSTAIDTASEVFNPSNAEVAIPQDSFNWNADRARSSYDRPHRFTGNFVYELPFFREQNGFVGRALGGFQFNSFIQLQSGAPFTVLLGDDPTGALSGIDALVGNAIRPNLASNANLSQMSLPEIRRMCGSPIAQNVCPNLFSRLAPGQRVGNAGRNIIRADSIRLIDFGIIKNTQITENVRFQLRADMFNVFNERNFGVPEGRINAPNFLNQWATNGGNRRVVLGARLVF